MRAHRGAGGGRCGGGAIFLGSLRKRLSRLEVDSRWAEVVRERQARREWVRWCQEVRAEMTPKDALRARAAPPAELCRQLQPRGAHVKRDQEMDSKPTEGNLLVCNPKGRAQAALSKGVCRNARPQGEDDFSLEQRPRLER